MQAAVDAVPATRRACSGRTVLDNARPGRVTFPSFHGERRSLPVPERPVRFPSACVPPLRVTTHANGRHTKFMWR